MKPFTYVTGETVRKGDRIRYHGEPGAVEFVVSGVVGDSAMDWYAERFPGGGIMITATGFGSVFLGVDDIDDMLEFDSRSEEPAKRQP